MAENGRILRGLFMCRWLSPALVAGAGIAMALVAFTVVRGWEQEARRQEFIRRAEDRTAALRRSIEHSLEEVGAIGGLFEVSQRVGRRGFRKFVSAGLKKYDYIQALEWIPRVPDAERRAYEAAARKGGLAGFEITDRQAQGVMVRASRREEYFPVYYVEPLAGNEAAVGFDLASNPIRLEALHRSRDTGETVATARITLVQEQENQYGFLLFRPVYKNGAPTGTVEERREHLQGFALGVFRVGALIEKAVSYLGHQGIDCYLYDASAPAAERFLHFHPSRTHVAPVEPAAEAELVAGLHHAATLEVADRRWLVLCAPAPAFLAATESWQSRGILAGGLLLSGILAAYVWLLLGRAERIREHAAVLQKAKQGLEREVAERRQVEKSLTESEEKFRSLSMAAQDAVLMIDDEGKLVCWNSAAQRIFGYSEQEALGQNVHKLLVPAHYHAASEKGYAGFRRTGTGPVVGKTLELEALRKDGSEFPIELSVSALKLNDRWHVVGILRDITERKQAEEQIERTLREKDLLLREIHHRVKNNLQIVASLLNLQSGQVEDRKALDAFRESIDRIQTLALLHEKLYRSEDIAHVDFGGYIRALTSHLFDSYRIGPSAVTLKSAIEVERLKLDTAIPCGLIVSELVSNCLKHAFPEGRQGKIEIALRRQGDGRLNLTVADDGVGLPPEVDIRNTGSLGLQLVNSLTGQLGGEIELRRGGDGGSVFRIVFPSSEKGRVG